MIAALDAGASSQSYDAQVSDELGVAAEGGLTPIPGLRVEVHEELLSTPIAVHEVVTGQEGEPLSPIILQHPDSDVIILSKDETIARFQSSGPAGEFLAPNAPAIIATPMVDAVGVCRGLVEGTPVVQFFYNNMNENNVDAGVPVTGLNPYLYRTPGTRADDLNLNAIYQGSNGTVIPGANFRDPPPKDGEQVFVNGQNSFYIPFSPSAGPVTWDFIGRRTVVTNETRLCAEEARPGCTELDPEKIRRLVVNLRRSVSGVLKAASKVMRVGSSPYLGTSAKAIREIKLRHKRLFGALVCPSNAAIQPSCAREPFPFNEFMTVHQGIFKKNSPVRPQMFKKLKKVYNKTYEKFLYETFPQEIVFCKKTR